MKLRRRKGATLGLVAVSVLVIIMIGVGCFFLAKICGGAKEVNNATDSGTLNIARAALRSQDASVPIAAYPDFASLADAKYGPAGGGLGMTLYTYNRAVAQALLVALNAQQEGTATAGLSANSEYTELTKVGQALTTALQTQATLQNRFNQVNSTGANQGNSLKMFGNNPINEVAYNVQWMKQAGSTNIWFYGDPSVPGQPSAIPPGTNYTGTLVSPSTNFAPGSVGASNPFPASASPKGQYMAGYSSVQVTIPNGTLSFIGVPVFPQQNPHLVSASDFQHAATNFVPPAGGNTPPNAFSVQSTSLNKNGGGGFIVGQNAMGGSLACAIVGCTIGTGNSPVTSPVHFPGSLPGGYVLISNRSAAAPPGQPPSWNNPVSYDDSNNIFNHELNAQGNEGDIMSVQSSGGTYVFYDDQSSAAPSSNGGQTIAQWTAYNNPNNSIPPGTADPVAPQQWNLNGVPQTGPPPISANMFVTDGSGGAYGSSGSTVNAPTTVNQNAVIAALKQVGSSEDCMNQMNSPPYYPTDAACGGNSLTSLSTAYGRGNGPAVGGTASPTMWSNVDNIKSQIIEAFHFRPTSLTLGPYSGGGPGGVGASPAASGLGSYKANMTDPEIASNITSANPNSRWASALSSPLEYTSVGESNNVPDPVGGNDAAVGTTVYAYLNQVNGCAIGQVLTNLVQRCSEIAPTVKDPVNGVVPTSLSSVTNLLKSNQATLYMGQSLYICKSVPTDPTSPLVISSNQPSTFIGSIPDGSNTTANVGSCSSTYGTSSSGAGGLLDSKSTNGSDGADNNLHDQPFMQESGSGIDATDHADFVLSSGYQNLLGKLDFYQTISTNGGQDQFSRPN